MRIERLENDVEVFVGDTYQSNATIFRSPDGALVVDALASAADARALIAHAGPIRLFALTHGFSDHLAALREAPGVPAVAHRSFADTSRRERFRSDEEAAFFREANVQLDAPASIQWGRHTLQLIPMPGHTESDLVVD